MMSIMIHEFECIVMFCNLVVLHKKRYSPIDMLHHRPSFPHQQPSKILKKRKIHERLIFLIAFVSKNHPTFGKIESFFKFIKAEKIT